eukprot:8057282-Alexandrium_andersonii.AAC.1
MARWLGAVHGSGSQATRPSVSHPGDVERRDFVQARGVGWGSAALGAIGLRGYRGRRHACKHARGIGAHR